MWSAHRWSKFSEWLSRWPKEIASKRVIAKLISNDQRYSAHSPNRNSQLIWNYVYVSHNLIHDDSRMCSCRICWWLSWYYWPLWSSNDKFFHFVTGSVWLIFFNQIDWNCVTFRRTCPEIYSYGAGFIWLVCKVQLGSFYCAGKHHLKFPIR